MAPMPRPTIVHISVQDPAHMTGGQGVHALHLARAQLALGYEVIYYSIRLRGEPSLEQYHFPEGTLTVHRFSVSDSEHIDTPYHGSEAVQYSRQFEFVDSFVAELRRRWTPDSCLINLHGFFHVPLAAHRLKDYRVLSTYNLLLSERMRRTGEQNQDMFWRVRAGEIASFFASPAIHAIAPGMKEEILHVTRDCADPRCRDELARYPLRVPEDPEVAFAEIETKISVVAHAVESIFLDQPIASGVEDTVGAWGRVSPEKGFEYLIEAAAQLPELRFKIWGTSGDAERSRRAYRERLESMAHECPNVSLDFRPGGIRGEERIALVDSVAIVVVPSSYEPFGLVNLEALSRGKPVVTSLSVGGRYIMGGDSEGALPWGYLVRSDSQLFAAAIRDALKSYFALAGAKRRLMQVAARTRAESFPRYEPMAQKLIEIMERSRA